MHNKVKYIRKTIHDKLVANRKILKPFSIKRVWERVKAGEHGANTVHTCI
jgi:hypothetical protein